MHVAASRVVNPNSDSMLALLFVCHHKEQGEQAVSAAATKGSMAWHTMAVRLTLYGQQCPVVSAYVLVVVLAFLFGCLCVQVWG